MLGATSLSSDDVAKSIENEMAPYLLEIMKMFFSKDVFYQPVKDLVERVSCHISCIQSEVLIWEQWVSGNNKCCM